MSLYQHVSLKQLLEDPNLINGPQQIHHQGHDKGEQSKSDSGSESSEEIGGLSGLKLKNKEADSYGWDFDPRSAFLQPNLWNNGPHDNNGGDLKLEYMDLDAFLTENGMADGHSPQHGSPINTAALLAGLTQGSNPSDASLLALAQSGRDIPNDSLLQIAHSINLSNQNSPQRMPASPMPGNSPVHLPASPRAIQQNSPIHQSNHHVGQPASPVHSPSAMHSSSPPMHQSQHQSQSPQYEHSQHNMAQMQSPPHHMAQMQSPPHDMSENSQGSRYDAYSPAPSAHSRHDSGRHDNYSSVSSSPVHQHHFEKLRTLKSPLARALAQMSSDEEEDVKVDYEVSEQDIILASVPGSDSCYDPRSRKFNDEELRPQPMIKKSKKVFVPGEQKDDRYWARRGKNNIAAKRSRDARRIKENQVALRASFLEKENDSMKEELRGFKKENMQLKERIQQLENLASKLSSP